MQTKDVLKDGFSRVQEEVDRTLEGMTAEQLAFRPDENANSMAWLVWHLARVQDNQMSEVAGREQAWIEDGWAEKFGMPPDPGNHGVGHTSKEVAGIKPDGRLLRDYYAAVEQRTYEYLEGIDSEELDRVVDRSYSPPVTAGVRTVSVLSDVNQHAGEASYVRGLIERRRWLPY